MNKPKMIFFDMGQTLIYEPIIDVRRGDAALLEYAVENKYGIGPDEVAARAKEINAQIAALGGCTPGKRNAFEIEVPFSSFNRYLLDSLGIRLSLTDAEAERIFWEASSPGYATDGIAEFLEFLHNNGIRTGVISNVSYSEQTVIDHINTLIPNNHFEFVIASSSYIFRKPNKMLFDLAIEKTDLNADEIWYVGDRFEFDAVGAMKSGMFPVLYTGACGDDEIHNDVLTVKHWDEFRKFIQEVETNA